MLKIKSKIFIPLLLITLAATSLTCFIYFIFFLPEFAYIKITYQGGLLKKETEPEDLLTANKINF